MYGFIFILTQYCLIVFPLQFCLIKQNGILILQKDIPLKGHLHVGCQNTYCCDTF